MLAVQEVAVCFGGRLMRGNRCQKTHSSFYQAFDSLSYPYLANLGVDVDWKKSALLEVKGVYRPRFEARTTPLPCRTAQHLCRFHACTPCMSVIPAACRMATDHVR